MLILLPGSSPCSSCSHNERSPSGCLRRRSLLLLSLFVGRPREAADRAANPRGLRRQDGQDGRRGDDGAEGGRLVSSTTLFSFCCFHKYEDIAVYASSLFSKVSLKCSVADPILNSFSCFFITNHGENPYGWRALTGALLLPAAIATQVRGPCLSSPGNIKDF